MQFFITGSRIAFLISLILLAGVSLQALHQYSDDDNLEQICRDMSSDRLGLRSSSQGRRPPKNEQDVLSAALIKAASCGDLEEVKALLAPRVDVNAIDKPSDKYGSKSPKGITALHRAAEEGHLDVVRELIGAKARVDMVNKEGETPLMIAAQKGHAEVVDFLIGAKANLEQQSAGFLAKGQTALALAASNNFPIVVGHILDNRADIDRIDNRGDSALSLAIQYCSDDAAVKLLRYGASTICAEKKDPTFIMAARNRCPKTIDFLLKQGANPNEIYQGQAVLTHAMLPNFPNGREMRCEIYNFITYSHHFRDRRLKATRDLLLDAKADINYQDKNGDTVLHYLVWRLPYCDENLCNRYDTADNKFWAHYHYAMIKGLVERGGDLNLKNIKDSTPIEICPEDNNDGQLFFAWAKAGFPKVPADSDEFGSFPHCNLNVQKSPDELCFCFPKEQDLQVEIAVLTKDANGLKKLLADPEVMNTKSSYFHETLTRLAQKDADPEILRLVSAYKADIEEQHAARKVVYERTAWDTDAEAVDEDLGDY